MKWKKHVALTISEHNEHTLSGNTSVWWKWKEKKQEDDDDAPSSTKVEFLSAVNNIFSLVFWECFHWKQFSCIQQHGSSLCVGERTLYRRAQLKIPWNMFHCYFMHLSCCCKKLFACKFLYFSYALCSILHFVVWAS